jgi:DNA-directed RNA polymerase specialized sigma24 family protein
VIAGATTTALEIAIDPWAEAAASNRFVDSSSLTTPPPPVRRDYERPGRHDEDENSPMRPKAFSKYAHRLAQLGICVQFLALVRTLAEFFLLQYVFEGFTISEIASHLNCASRTVGRRWSFAANGLSTSLSLSRSNNHIRFNRGGIPSLDQKR